MKKIMPCMDIKNGKVVKGVNFENIREIDDPVRLAEYYDKSGADELVFYDIGASVEGGKIFDKLFKDVRQVTDLPLTAGGGIGTLEDADRLFKLGADRVSINTGAIMNPSLIREVSNKYGRERVILSVDVKRTKNGYSVFTGAGRIDTGLDAKDWINLNVKKGAGAVVINSIDTDGVREGFDIKMLRDLAENLPAEVIASGGAGKADDFVTLFEEVPFVDTALAASIFHFGEVKPEEVKGRIGRSTTAFDIDELKFDDRGLIPVVVQESGTGKVLTLAYMNRESLEISMKKELTCFYSRSRKNLWLKGESSGNFQHIVSITADCDKDALLVKVEKDGPACHLGNDSCFENLLWKSGTREEFMVKTLEDMLKDRKKELPDGSYTTYLFEEGIDKILKKIGEEATEVIIAAKAKEREETIYEIADLVYHLLVLMVYDGIESKEIIDELASRHVIDYKIKQEKMV